MSAHGGKRPGAGRKPSEDPRIMLQVRIPRSKMEAATAAAESAGETMTEWVETAIDAALHPRHRRRP